MKWQITEVLVSMLNASLFGGLEALLPVGSRGKAPGQGIRGGKPPEADDILTANVNILGLW